MFAMLTGPLVKMIAIASVAMFAFYYVWDMGRDSERAKWETAMRAEVERQTELLDAARQDGAALAAQLRTAGVERSTLLRRLQDEARTAANAGNACLDADSVMRLNALRN